jgi:hypothetical protein
MKTKNDVLNEFLHDKKGDLEAIILVEILLDIRDQVARIADHLAGIGKMVTDPRSSGADCR